MKTVYVTRSQQMAAEALVERAERFGRPVEPWIVKVAKAREPRSADPAGAALPGAAEATATTV